MKRLFVIIIILSFFSCKRGEKDFVDQIITDIEQLTTDDLKGTYLERIFEEDQRVRQETQKITYKYGAGSKEEEEGYNKIKKIDATNLLKIELYLNAYDHPTIAKHGERACYAPWIVIHHSSTIETRERNFEYLYSAFKNKDLKSSSFLMYLNRFHSMKFGKRFTLPNPYKEEDMIEAMIDRLGFRKSLKWI